MGSTKLKELCGEALRTFVLKKQWERYERGPEVIHEKPYPVLTEQEVKRDIEIFDNTFNPELKAI